MVMRAADVWAWLDEVKDPEVPVLSVVELGIVRDVQVEDADVTVTITPTYSGCPAMHEIEQEIRRALGSHGAQQVTLETVYSPPWTTDWMSEDAKRKLSAYGIAPPGRVSEESGIVSIQSRRTQEAAAVTCPYCGSRDTELRSFYGSTACKAIQFCRSCQQPFEEFKAI
jgi:ring-1,2-phenylacetyl-CoA epoxidase subunit PaaD